MNYLTYPVKTMNVTQSYAGGTSHAPHSSGSPADYPIDEACMDGGRDWFYCPCDEVKIVNIYGLNNSVKTNTVWFTSTSPVVMPTGKDIITIMVEHPNDDDLKKLKIGQIFKRGQAMFREGSDGNATGNHFHIAVATGKFLDPGWQLNSKNVWVLKTTGRNLRPEEAFYIDKSFTTLVKKNGGISFKSMPIEKKIDKYFKVTADILNIRSAAGTAYDIVATYKKGSVFRSDKTSNGWFHSALGWVSGDYITEVKKGDVNFDGKITSEDSRIATRASVGLENLSSEQIAIADMDGDGKVTTADARGILRKSVDLD